MFIRAIIPFFAAMAIPVIALSGTATTTRYYDGQKGSSRLTRISSLPSLIRVALAGGCGCGNNSGAFGWTNGISTGVYTAASVENPRF